MASYFKNIKNRHSHAISRNFQSNTKKKFHNFFW